MAKRPEEASGRTEPGSEQGQTTGQADSSRRERLRMLLGHCTAARAEAEALGERLLTYLLAMAIEEIRETAERSRDPIGPLP